MISLKQRAIRAYEALVMMETKAYGDLHGGFAAANEIREELDMSVPLCYLIHRGYCTPSKDAEGLIHDLECAVFPKPKE